MRTVEGSKSTCTSLHEWRSNELSPFDFSGKAARPEGPEVHQSHVLAALGGFEAKIGMMKLKGMICTGSACTNQAREFDERNGNSCLVHNLRVKQE